jgi:molybdenum cofactor cytidylyltransferase
MNLDAPGIPREAANESRGGLLLSKALRLQRRTVVSFVGAGGKTSAMFRLARELAASGWRVVTTTTTHLGENQISLAPAWIQIERADSLPGRLDRFGHCLITGPPVGSGRILGISIDQVTALHSLTEVDCVLVEADGSRGCPFKAPAEHEPVLPPLTTHVVPVAGMEVIGLSLDGQNVHRPELVSGLTGLPLGSPITADAVAKVLTHDSGGAKHLPQNAKLIPLLNKADDAYGLHVAGTVAGLLIQHPAVDRVLAGSMQAEMPVREVWTQVAGIVLAAGQSLRFGSPKQLLPWGENTLVAQAAQIALSAGLSPVVVVTGHECERVRQAVAHLPVQTVFNPDYAAGQGGSVAVAVRTLPAASGAAVFLLADQPAVTSALVRRLVQAHRETSSEIVLPEFEGKRGNPVLFDKILFPELALLSGEAGGRVLLEKHRASIFSISVNHPGILQDIDTPEDFARIVRHLQSTGGED